jgi:hypothetical protein
MRKYNSRSRKNKNKNVSKSKIKRGGGEINPLKFDVPVPVTYGETGGQASIDKMNAIMLKQNELNKTFTGGSGIVGNKIVVPTFINSGEDVSPYNANSTVKALTKIHIDQQNDSVYDATRPQIQQNQTGGKYRKHKFVNRTRTKNKHKYTRKSFKKYRTLKSRRNRNRK